MLQILGFVVGLVFLILGPVITPPIENWLVFLFPVLDPIVTPLVLGLWYGGLALYGAYHVFKNGGRAVGSVKKALKAHRERQAAKQLLEQKDAASKAAAEHAEQRKKAEEMVAHQLAEREEEARKAAIALLQQKEDASRAAEEIAQRKKEIARQAAEQLAQQEENARKAVELLAQTEADAGKAEALVRPHNGVDAATHERAKEKGQPSR